MKAGSLQGFVGRFGAGKTLLMTWKAYKDHGQVHEVWSNYGLNAEKFSKAEHHRIRSGQDLFDLMRVALDNEDGRPGGTKRLVVLDELHSLFDARAWAQVPLELLTPLSQLRKAGLTIYYTSQHESQIEKRIRNYTNLLWLCKAWGQEFNFRRPAPIVFWASAFDAFEFRQRGAKPLDSVMFRLTKKRTRLYDTFEVVERMELATVSMNGGGVSLPSHEEGSV